MGLIGNLRDMAVADLIQHQCADRKTAKVTIKNLSQTALVFFKGGEVVHAQLGQDEGEEVIFDILRWEEGTFSVESGVESPKITIQRTWSGLLMEGAKRLDEEAHASVELNSTKAKKSEANQMVQKLDEILNEMSAEVNGYIASALVGMDGLNIAQHTKNAKVNLESVSAQSAMHTKMAISTMEKIGMGHIEDNLIQTREEFLFTILLPNDNQHFLCVVVNRKDGSLGNLRLISKIYAERLSKAMPR